MHEGLGPIRALLCDAARLRPHTLRVASCKQFGLRNSALDSKQLILEIDVQDPDDDDLSDPAAYVAEAEEDRPLSRWLRKPDPQTRIRGFSRLLCQERDLMA